MGDTARGEAVHPLAKHSIGVSPAVLAQLRSLQGGGQSQGPSVLARVPSAAHIVPGLAAPGSAGEAVVSDG